MANDVSDIKLSIEASQEVIEENIFKNEERIDKEKHGTLWEIRKQK